MNFEHIPLLSGKPFSAFTVIEFKAHVVSLYNRITPVIKIKPPKPDFVWKLTPKGALSIKLNRKEKYLTPAEIDQIAMESKIEKRLVWLKILGKRSSISLRR